MGVFSAKSILGKFLGVDYATGDLVGKSGLVMARSADNRVTNVTASTLTVTQDSHDGKVVTLNRAAGVTVTLPAATGSGAFYRFYIGTSASGGSYVIKVANSSDTFKGGALAMADAGDTVVGFECASTSDTWTGNGTTTGGILGDYIEIVDVAANVFLFESRQSGTGTEATPFSTTV